jgi:flagellar motor protein MotB
MKAHLAAIGLVLALSGCARNPMMFPPQAQGPSQDHFSIAQQTQEMERRLKALADDNEDLENQLAQAKQYSRTVQDELGLMREQLKGTADQLVQVQEQFRQSEERARTYSASNRRPSAGITANSNLKDRLPEFVVPGVEARMDGDVVRVELPGSRLFSSGDSRLLPEAGRLIDSVAAELIRAYPDQIIGIEGHTDSDPVRGGAFTSNHQLSVARAMAVYDYLASRPRLRPAQMLVVGHGANHPVVSNATPAGKERNRRVELVVYPETVEP